MLHTFMYIYVHTHPAHVSIRNLNNYLHTKQGTKETEALRVQGQRRLQRPCCSTQTGRHIFMCLEGDGASVLFCEKDHEVRRQHLKGVGGGKNTTKM